MISLVLVCAGVLAADPTPDDLGAYREAKAKAGRDADAHVKLALWCEAQGLDAERVSHLATAILADPANAAARGLLGLVAFRDKWQKPEAVAERVKSDAELAEALAEYNARRGKTPRTADAQWRLALWCEERGLKAEAQAHLTTVVRLDPGRAAAWKKLGYKKHNGRWTTPEQVARAKADREDQADADKHWGPLLARWRKDLADPDTRAEAESALAGVTDPRAVPSAWKVFALGRPEDQARAVQLLGQIDAPGASRALAALAVYADSADVRRIAAETLRRRDGREFLGLLVGLVRSPLRYQVKPVNGPGSPGVLLVEGERYNVRRFYDAPPPPPNLQRLFSDAVPFDPFGPQSPFSGSSGGLLAAEQFASSTRLADRNGGIDMREVAYQRDVQIALNQIEAQAATAAENRQIARDIAAVESYNQAVHQVNDRVLPTLNALTGEDLGEDGPAWNQWWVDQQGYAAAADPYKPTITQEFGPIQPDYQNGIIPFASTHSCFAAGTPVLTLTGPKPIESIRVGDRLLTRDTEKGGLSYQPVLAVFHNKPNRTLRVGLGDESIVATGIHRFWVAGKGWVMARDLKPGDALRTVAGTSRVASVADDRVQPVFNLEVAENASFFVGASGLLVHDNSLVAPTPRPFDAGPTLSAVSSRP